MCIKSFPFFTTASAHFLEFVSFSRQFIPVLRVERVLDAASVQSSQHNLFLRISDLLMAFLVFKIYRFRKKCPLLFIDDSISIFPGANAMGCVVFMYTIG
jgi:hypothetical protein